MTWIIIALLFAAAAAGGFRIQALTRDEPPEPSAAATPGPSHRLSPAGRQALTDAIDQFGREF
jgi:hypothetical protein